MKVEIINIYSRSSRWVERMLSNFAHTPFVLDEHEIASVEGFHQGIKYEDFDLRVKIFGLHGIKAKQRGKEANTMKSGYVYWGSRDSVQKIRWQSKEYLDLYYRALLAKFSQNQEAKAALLSTGEAYFSHNVRRNQNDFDAFQKTHFCKSLYLIRKHLNTEWS